MTESTHALEHWLNLQANEAIKIAMLNQPLSIQDVNWCYDRLNATRYAMLRSRSELPTRNHLLQIASLALRLAAIAHRESVQGGEIA